MHLLNGLKELLAVVDLVRDPPQDPLEIHGTRVQLLERRLRTRNPNF